MPQDTGAHLTGELASRHSRSANWSYSVFFFFLLLVFAGKSRLTSTKKEGKA